MVVVVEEGAIARIQRVSFKPISVSSTFICVLCCQNFREKYTPDVDLEGFWYTWHCDIVLLLKVITGFPAQKQCFFVSCN